jgi:putative transposase
MFEDEAGFGRISTPAVCWAPSGIRPIVCCHHIREYEYAYGAVDPIHGDKFFLVMPNCNTECMNVFLRELSEEYPNDYILLPLDNAVWHKSKTLQIPDNIRLFYLPPRIPEMNPIEQIWKEIRKRGFKNKTFQTLEKVVERLSDTCISLTNSCVKSITGRDWILSMF